MKFKEANGGYIIRLFKGEKIVQCLTDLCRKEKIFSGVLQGIGGTLKAELGFYDVEKKEYKFRKFEEIMEIVNLAGNIAKVDNEPFLHVHAALSNRNFETFGGHLKEATVGATCEVFLRNINIDLTRTFDEEIGLKLLDCESQ